MLKKTGLVLATLLCLPLATGIAVAASNAPAAAPAPPLDELEEILIQGQRLINRISNAEDDFYPLYNKANDNDDFDINCAHAYVNPDSRIMSRVCLPGFLGKDYGPPVSSWGPCYGTYYGTFRGNGYSYSYYAPGYRRGAGYCSAGGYEPISYEFIIFAKRDEMRKQMLKVINSDPELQARATHLGQLYMQLGEVENRFRKAKGLDQPAARRTRAAKASTGPRSGL